MPKDDGGLTAFGPLTPGELTAWPTITLRDYAEIHFTAAWIVAFAHTLPQEPDHKRVEWAAQEGHHQAERFLAARTEEPEAPEGGEG